jgi:hypothetical protein
MSTTASELQDLLVRVNDATKLLRRSKTVPAEVAELIDSFGSLRLEADPYLTATLWAAAYGAEKALRRDNEDEQRRDVRIALDSSARRCATSSKIGRTTTMFRSATFSPGPPRSWPHPRRLSQICSGFPFASCSAGSLTMAPSRRQMTPRVSGRSDRW